MSYVENNDSSSRKRYRVFDPVIQVNVRIYGQTVEDFNVSWCNATPGKIQEIIDRDVKKRLSQGYSLGNLKYYALRWYEDTKQWEGINFNGYTCPYIEPDHRKRKPTQELKRIDTLDDLTPAELESKQRLGL